MDRLVWTAQDTVEYRRGAPEGDEGVAPWSAVVRCRHERGRALTLEYRGAVRPVAAARPRPSRLYDTALVISNLQKAVRRQNARAALASFDYLRAVAPTKLLRRVPVVIVEDTEVDGGFAAAVWLMAAVSKGYAPAEAQWGAVRTTLARAVMCPRTVDAERTPATDEYFPYFADLIDRWALPTPQSRCAAALVVALGLRRDYGGLHGDQGMLGAQARMWTARLRLRSAAPPRAANSALAPPAHVELEQAETQLPQSADFHCCCLLQQALDAPDCPPEPHALSAPQLRAIVWTHRSGVNHRAAPPAAAPPWWPAYCAVLDRLAPVHWAPLETATEQATGLRQRQAVNQKRKGDTVTPTPAPPTKRTQPDVSAMFGTRGSE